MVYVSGLAQEVSNTGLSLLQAVIDAVPVPIFFKDSEGRYLGCNSAFEEYIGMTRDQLVGKGVFELFDPGLAEVYYKADRDLFESGGKQIYEAQVEYADGTIHDVVFHKAVFHAKADGISGIVGALLDISDRKKAENELQRMALTDSLTGLSNRFALLNELDHLLMRARRTEELNAFLMIDLDDFKYVNDTFGHPAGDELLKEVSARLKQSVRETDIVARIGGDEFAIALVGISSEEVATKISEKILSALSAPILAEGHDVSAAASIGIACAPKDGEDSRELMKSADIALYRAKAKGKNTFEFKKRLIFS